MAAPGRPSESKHKSKGDRMNRLPNASRRSYGEFLAGMADALDQQFPLDLPQGAVIDVHSPALGPPERDIDVCRLWVKTHSAPVTAQVSISIYDPEDLDDPDADPEQVLEARLPIGDIPIMLPNGSFLVNGLPAVLVPSLDRSPGILRTKEEGSWEVKLVPASGPWVSLLRMESSPIIWARINTAKPMPASTLLRALGMDDDAMFDLAEDLHGTVEYRVARNSKGRRGLLRRTGSGRWAAASVNDLAERALADPVGDHPAGSELFPADLRALAKPLAPGGWIDFRVLDDRDGPSLPQTCGADDTEDEKGARTAVGRMLAAKDASDAKALSAFDEAVEAYSLSDTGIRHILNSTGESVDDGLTADLVLVALRELVRFEASVEPSDNTYALENRRLLSVGSMMLDALGQGMRYWIMEMEKLVRETGRAASRPGRRRKDDSRPRKLTDLTPEHVAMPRYITAAMRRLLTGPKAQKMGNPNPLAEVMHRCRVVLEAGQSSKGGSPPAASRWVDDSQFRRLSASESPEGPLVGLVNYTSLFARADEHGFLATPALRIKDGAATGRASLLAPHAEKRAVLAIMGVDADGKLVADPRDRGMVNVRVHEDGGYVTKLLPPEMVTHATVSSDDSLSPAAALVPFVEHDDSTRIAMASAMTRQAVTCVRNERPYVGTGREMAVAEAAGDRSVVLSPRDGTVSKADGRVVTVVGGGPGTGHDRYSMSGGALPSSGPWPRMVPAVRPGQKVEKGQHLAHGEAVAGGGLALGQNLRVAYMNWHGYNFEDSIVISERLARDDVLTSLHIRQFSCKASSTLLGPEEITADLPGVGADELVNLDDDGIIRIGSVVRERCILVGKVAPKDPSEEESAEEKLLRMVFDRSHGKVKDASLRMPPGYDGAVVVDARTMTIRGNEQGLGPTDREAAALAGFKAERKEMLAEAQAWVRTRLLDLAGGAKVEKAPGMDAGGVMSRRWLSRLPMKRWTQVRLADRDADREFHSTLDALAGAYAEAKAAVAVRSAGPDDIAGGSGTLRRVVVTVAYRRRIQPGDKLAGRHGNKGVVSRVVPVEDMPFDPDTGEAVDIILNPLGVPSRMNIGQVLETHLGWAIGEIGRRVERVRALPERLRSKSEARLHKLAVDIGWRGLDLSSPRAMSDDIARNGITIDSPAFDGVKEADIKRLLRFVGLPASGQCRLRDGITGDEFDRPVTVGSVYIYKLHHMVEDKVHARSRGRYTSRNQQPVQGRSNHGGQRLGEMEVWALEGYGAAYNLLEMTTAKSDDVAARRRVDDLLATTGEARLADVLPGMTGQLSALDEIVYLVRCLGLDMHEVVLDGDGNEAEAPEGGDGGEGDGLDWIESRLRQELAEASG